MKTNHMFQGWIKNTVRLGLVGGLSLLMGYASSSMAQTTQTNQTTQPKQKEKKNKVPPLPEGVKLHKDQNIQGVWLADGFNFKGYQTLYIAPTVFAAVERDNEIDIREMAMQLVPEQLATQLRDTKVFANVTTNSADMKPGTKSLKLENTIIEYSKGSAAGREFGYHIGGQPNIKVRGQIYDGDKLVCVFEIKRSGVGAEARMSGGGMSSEEIQRNDIRVLARDVASFVRRTAE
ncbi:MAG: hypothetical protein ABSC89_05045 [Verrucomicrobiota bacterium]|jgi:hypothetical protein